MKSILRLLLAALPLALLFMPLQAQDNTSSRELQVKAAYLYNFTRFVTWEKNPAAGGGKIIIGFIGAGEIADVLDSFLRSSGNDKQVEVRRFPPDSENLDKCHILFIEPGNGVQLDNILKKIKMKPILTVGDTPDFVKRGGMVGLFEEGGRIRIRLDLERAESAGMNISSKLIEVSQLVNPEGT